MHVKYIIMHTIPIHFVTVAGNYVFTYWWHAVIGTHKYANEDEKKEEMLFVSGWLGLFLCLQFVYGLL